MPKSDDTFDPADYTPVAERITRFYEQYPGGRIITKPRRVNEEMVLFEARVYRAAGDRRPAATGFASERPGDGDINTVACIENTETSAIGRALANLGITAGRRRPSREEMSKAERARGRMRPIEFSNAAAAAPPAVLATADDIVELARMLVEAEARGFDEGRATELRDLLDRVGSGAAQPEPLARTTLLAIERELRDWLGRRDRAR
jgi:hypothetical protein